MKITTKHHKRGLLLSILCAIIATTFMAGCADTGYVTAYDNGYYYPTTYYTRDYYSYYGYPSSYYGPRYRVIGSPAYAPYYYSSYYY